MDNEVRVCPFCGQPPGVGVFCEACGRNLAGVERLPTRAEWDSSHAADLAGRLDPAAASRGLAERCTAAGEAFLAAMHAAGDPGTTDVFPKRSGLRRVHHPAAWVLRPVHREPGDDVHRYEPGLVLTTEGRFHPMESLVRGWGQRNFPVFVDNVAPEPIEMPVEARLIAELDAVLRENAVFADPALTSL